MQTADGVESFLVDGAVVTSGGNFVRFSIPTVLSTLLNGIAIDDRFIFAITAPVVSVFTGNAEPINWSFGVSNATGSTVPPHFTGNAESITWSFGISNATGSATIPGVSGNAEPINWSFGVSQATGTATAAAPSSVLTLGVIGVDAWEGAILLPSELIDGGVEAYFRFFTLLGNSPQMRLAATATGDPEGIGPRFTSEVEGYVEAFTFSTDLTDTYTIPGPDYPTNQFRDPTEPYFWTPPPGMQGLSVWLGNRLTSVITLTIGRSEEPTAFTGQASPISWSFGISNATGTTVPPHFTGNAEIIQWSFGISNATGSTVPLHFTGDAESINWSFGVSNATGTTVPPHFTGDAESINWSFGVSNATGTTVPLHFTGQASPITWSFGISNATGTTSTLIFTGQATPINWSFGISAATGSTVPTPKIAFDFEYPVATTTLALIKITPVVLELSDSDDTGLDVAAKALIDASSASIIYADANRGGTQTPGDIDANSDLTIGPDGTLITRIRILDSGTRININDNDLPNALNLSTFFGLSDTESEWTLYIQTLDGVVSSNQLKSMSNNFANFVFTGDDATFLNSIVSGERLIFKIAQLGALVPEIIEFDFTYLAAMATVAVTSRLTDHENIEISFAYPVAMATAAVTKITPPQQFEEIEIDTTYQVLQTAIALTKRQVDMEQIAFDFQYRVPITVVSLVKNFSKPLFGFKCDNESYIVGFCATGSTWLACIQGKRLIGFLHSYEASTTTVAIRKIEVQDPKAPLYDVFKDFSLVEPRIDKVLTQYRESEKLLSMYRVYLRQIEIVAQVLENIAQVFNIERAVGDQLTLLGRRMGWPREQTLCAREPVFGFTGGKTTTTPIAGFCQPFSTWSHCGTTRARNYTMTDNYTYRKFLKVRRYQMLFLYSLKYVRLAVKELWGDSADVIRIKENEIIVATGRLLNTDELSIIALYARVLPIFPTMQVKIHLGGSNVFGFGEGYDGFCNAAEWLCPLDPEPYKCVGD